MAGEHSRAHVLCILCGVLACARLAVAAEPDPRAHWAFQPLQRPQIAAAPTNGASAVDRLVEQRLLAAGLTLGPQADPRTLLRRLSLDLCGVPPSPDELAEFARDPSPAAYAAVVERYLASPLYAERWARPWLDAAGYADSNGYFNADSDRPLAYRYRDYVIRALEADKPFDQFVREQLAGDELAQWKPGVPADLRTVELITATHFLRNGQDGTSESDGNPDEVLADRFTALEGTLQITCNALFGLTIQCARCHDHKFEPLSQREYYQLQAIFYPAFPAFDPDKWIKPRDRVVNVATAAEEAAFVAAQQQHQARVAALTRSVAEWVQGRRVFASSLFEATFPDGRPLADAWSASAPGDDAPGGEPPVGVDRDAAPGAVVRDGALEIIESGGPGDRCLSTRQSFDWTPDEVGGWIQATFDLVADKAAGSMPAARIGYFIALADFNDRRTEPGGGLLVDGNPGGGTAVFTDYPGADASQVGAIGETGYVPGRNYGVRVTQTRAGVFHLQHVVDGAPEGKPLELSAAKLPDGGFGFEYCCGRSFSVDNVRVERYRPSDDPEGAVKKRLEEFAGEHRQRSEELQRVRKQPPIPPAQTAWVSDVQRSPTSYLLKRGLYKERQEPVEPGVPQVLSAEGASTVLTPAPLEVGTGRRLALAQWLTAPGSRPAALLARVAVNRLWQQHFGRGLVPTPDNFGRSGTPPLQPELLELLACELVDHDWSLKHVQRLIVHAAVYRQSSLARPREWAADPDNRLWWRFPPHRLDADALRDSLLWISGELDLARFGPYVPSQRRATGDVVIDEQHPGARRRSIYLQQRRTQVVSLLELFDAPSLVAGCAVRPTSTVPLQSLALLNSEFLRLRSGAFARRVLTEGGADESARIAFAFIWATGRPPSAEEAAAAALLLREQAAERQGQADAEEQAWTDLCQMLLASNACLYVE